MRKHDDLHLTRAQYAKILVNIRNDIASGSELTAVDSDCQGDKYTRCSWGLCSDKPSHFNEPGMRMWDGKPDKEGLISAKYRDQGMACPFDNKEDRQEPMRDTEDGCFYHCRIFQARRMSGGVSPSRSEAVDRFNAAILKAKS